MKLPLIAFCCLQAKLQLVLGFSHSSSALMTIRTQIPDRISWKATASDQQEESHQISEEERQLYEKFQNIAQRLRVSIHSHGFDSKDPAYGIERVCATIPVDPSMYVTY